MDFLPLDRAGNRRFLPVVTEAVEPEIHILENEAESRTYIMQVWAEAMEIYRSGNFSMKFDKAIRDQLLNVQRDCMPEDEKLGMIQAFLERYTGDAVCCRQLYAEALHRTDEPKRWDSRAIADIMRNNFKDEWEPFPNPRSFGPIYGKQKGWQRIVRDEPRGDADDSEFLCKPGNQVRIDQQGFLVLTKQEEIESGVYDVFPDTIRS